MSIDIFISYASQDRDRVLPLVTALKARGWSVWWDREIVPGARFEARIEDALAQARCVVVVWTETSVASDWVRAEALEGLGRHVLVPLTLDPVRLPLSFRHQNAAQLNGWTGDPEHAEYKRLITGIEEVLAGIAVDEDSVPVAEQPRRSRRRQRTVAAGIVGALLLAAGLWWAWQPRAGRPAEVPPNSVAVLRFVNLGPPADDYRSVGVSLELLNLLTRMRELLVASQASSFALQGDAAQIRQRLAVRYFVEGSYRQQGDRITVEAQLVDSGTGYRLWSESIEGGSETLVSVPIRIAQRVVESLKVDLSEESLRQLQSASTTNPQALDAYLQGVEWLRAPTDDATLAAAEEAFTRAVGLDPEFAMPYGGLCRVHLVRYRRGNDVDEFTAAESACQHTLSLNNLQADPYKALGELYLASGRIDEAESQYQTAQRLSSRDAEAVIGLAAVADRRGAVVDAEREYRQAIALEPHYWRTYASLGHFLFEQARFKEAEAEYERLTQLEPGHADAWGNLGAARYMQGEFDRALAAWQKALELKPRALAYSNVGTAYFFLNRMAESVRMYERAVELEPKDHRFWGHLGDARELLGQREGADAAYEKAAELARQNLVVDAGDSETRVQLAGYDARLGREELARQALAETLQSAGKDPYLYYDAAVAYTRLGMTDEALQALATAVEGGYPRHLVAADPQFAALRTTDGFSRLVRRK
jgi:tetratricopeptide (TPR) repeat protein